ncbi:MAG: hypothetical protein HN576_04570 [Bacteriovoracaceae bacterium]|jgi:hypothetical protein|nr:hypothetical protein [Bacteriovoracaceae bacterium]
MSEDDNKDNNKDNKIADIIKKVVSVGVGAAFMTEDAVKNILSDLPLPKDIVTGLLQNAKTAKEDFSNTIREELRTHLSKVDPKSLMEELVEHYDIEFNTKVSFKKKESNRKGTSVTKK